MRQVFQNEFYRLKSQELLFTLRQAQSIIHNHNLSRGLIAESILRDFLKTFLPQKVKITQGFIEYNGQLSPQCDIILYDQFNYAPIYRYGEVEVITYKAVIAVIEVKSCIDCKVFGKVLHDFETLYSMGVNHKYLFIYNSKLLKTLKGYFWGKYVPDYGRQNNESLYDHDNFNALPDAIISLQHDYFLKKAYCHADFGDADMKGYIAYSVTDNANKEIASIHAFLKDLLELVEPINSNDYRHPMEWSNDNPKMNDEMKYLIVKEEIPLFAV